MRDSERNRQQEELGDHLPRQSASHQIAELAGDVLKQQKRRERRQGEHERSDVLLEDVPVDYFHERYGLACCVARSRNFKNSTGLYGRARPVYSTRQPLEFSVPETTDPRFAQDDEPGPLRSG